jgi:hypothetical protein
MSLFQDSVAERSVPKMLPGQELRKHDARDSNPKPALSLPGVREPLDSASDPFWGSPSEQGINRGDADMCHGAIASGATAHGQSLCGVLNDPAPQSDLGTPGARKLCRSLQLATWCCVAGSLSFSCSGA